MLITSFGSASRILVWCIELPFNAACNFYPKTFWVLWLILYLQPNGHGHGTQANMESMLAASKDRIQVIWLYWFLSLFGCLIFQVIKSIGICFLNYWMLWCLLTNLIRIFLVAFYVNFGVLSLIYEWPIFLSASAFLMNSCVILCQWLVLWTGEMARKCYEHITVLRTISRVNGNSLQKWNLDQDCVSAMFSLLNFLAILLMIITYVFR